MIPGEPGKPRVVYFVGCMTNFVYTETAEAALALFRHLGCTVIIPKEQQCCGLPGMSGGDLHTVRELAEKNLAQLEKYEADYITTACATCGGALSRFYPLVVGKRNPELAGRIKAIADKTVDATVLLQKLGLNPQETGAGPGMRITYHDPCHLRTHGITKQPREMLQGVEGVDLAEMEGAGTCCGLGGTFNVYHYDSSMAINAVKSQAILDTGACGRGHRLPRLHDAAFGRAQAARCEDAGHAYPGNPGAEYPEIGPLPGRAPRVCSTRGRPDIPCHKTLFLLCRHIREPNKAILLFKMNKKIFIDNRRQIVYVMPDK